MRSRAAIVDESKLANASAAPYLEAFASHRARLTAQVAAHPGGRLCVLGAGNAYDLDLAALALLFSEIHLVDIDEAALERAFLRHDVATRARLHRHAPVELTGLLDKLDRWCALKVQPEELMEHPKVSSTAVAGQLPGPFDVVVSACVLTQLQLAVTAVLSPTHRLFEAVRQIVNLAHLRTLAKLVVPGGRVVFASDVTSNATAPLDGLDEDADLRPLLARLTREGNIIYASNPELLAWMVREDPYLQTNVSWSPPNDAWLWHNGPAHTFLVYACEMRRRAP